MRTEEVQQAGKEFVSNRKSSRHDEFWKSEVRKTGRYEMLALFVIFGLHSAVSYLGWAYGIELGLLRR
jgi:hypothetical protein